MRRTFSSILYSTSVFGIITCFPMYQGSADLEVSATIPLDIEQWWSRGNWIRGSREPVTPVSLDARKYVSKH